MIKPGVTVDNTAPDPVLCTENACYSGSKSISCSTASSDATVRYTTNGNNPTCSSTAWSNQSINATTTLKVIACDGA